MRIGFIFLSVILALAVVAPHNAYAGFVNLGFEAGSAGWDLFDPGGGGGGNNTYSGGVPYTSDALTDYYAPQGNSFQEIKGAGTLLWTVVSQSATLFAGEEVCGMAAFDSLDYRRDAAGNADLNGIYGNDRAKVEIYTGVWTAQQISQGVAAGSLVVTPWERSVWNDGTQVGLDYLAIGGDGSSSTPPFPDDPWTQWNYTLAVAGDYTLAYSIQNGLDPSLDEGAVTTSHALYDTCIPEARPVALLGLGLGLFVLMGYCRRRCPC